MNIAKACIRHKVTTILSAVMVAIFGIMYASQLQMALLPDMEMPMAVVMTTYVGATPGDIEELVTEPLEAAIMSVAGIDSIQSQSSESVSIIMITYENDTDTDIAATRLREKFDRVSLPDDVSDPVIVNMNMSELMPTAMIALVGDDLTELENTANDIIVPGLERIEGVAQVSVYGGLEQQIAVDVNTARAAGLGLSGSYIAQFLAGQNLLYPGGDMNNGSKTLTVSTDAKFQSVEDVANMLISLPTGGTVRLSEVADVYMETLDPDAMAKVDGGGAVMLQVSKQSGANEMNVARQVEKRMTELKKDNPSITYTIPYIASDYIDQVVSGAVQNILQGVILAAVVVFLFLRRGSATMTIAISMPVCILAVFVVMKFMDLTLNMMSLGGIAMGVGMIVDNSIVVLENINRFSREGHDRMSACVDQGGHLLCAGLHPHHHGGVRAPGPGGGHGRRPVPGLLPDHRHADRRVAADLPDAGASAVLFHPGRGEGPPPGGEAGEEEAQRHRSAAQRPDGPDQQDLHGPAELLRPPPEDRYAGLRGTGGGVHPDAGQHENGADPRHGPGQRVCHHLHAHRLGGGGVRRCG